MYDPLAKGIAGVCHHIWMPFWLWSMFLSVSITGEQSHIPLDLSIDMIYNMSSLFKPTSPGSTEKSFIISTVFYCASIFSSSFSFPSFSSPEQTAAKPSQHLPLWVHRWLPFQLTWWSIFIKDLPSHRFPLSLAFCQLFLSWLSSLSWTFNLQISTFSISLCLWNLSSLVQNTAVSPSTAVHTYNLSPLEAEAAGQQSQGEHGQHSKTLSQNNKTLFGPQVNKAKFQSALLWNLNLTTVSFYLFNSLITTRCFCHQLHCGF